jgi:hypothetical protein
MHYSDEYPSFPGQVNVEALNASPEVIQSAFVKKDEERKDATIHLGFYPGTSEAQKREACALALKRVLVFLGDGWGAVVVRNQDT